MPANNVQWAVPLTRLTPWYPGQMGVPGADSENGLRMHSTGTVFYVDPNYPGATTTADGTDPTNPLSTVAAALARCQPYRGDVIAVMANNAWQYGRAADGYNLPIAEEVIVTVPGLRIVGIAPAGSLGVVWTPASNGGTCITVIACDVTIEGFCFTEGTFNGCDAIYAEWNGATAWGDNLTVRHCAFMDTIDTAIDLEFVWYANITDNVFEECDAYGVYVDPAGSGIGYCNIHDNTFKDCATGALSLSGADDCRVYNNRIYNSAAQAGGAATNEGINTTGGSDNLVSDNYFSCVLPVAAPGDYDDLNTAAATDAWVGNHCMNGLAVTNPT